MDDTKTAEIIETINRAPISENVKKLAKEFYISFLIKNKSFENQNFGVFCEEGDEDVVEFESEDYLFSLVAVKIKNKDSFITDDGDLIKIRE